MLRRTTHVPEWQLIRAAEREGAHDAVKAAPSVMRTCTSRGFAR